MRITSDDDLVVVDVTAAQGPPGPPGPEGPPGEPGGGGGDGIPQGGPLTEDLYTGGFEILGADAAEGTGASLIVGDATGGGGGSLTLSSGASTSGHGANVIRLGGDQDVGSAPIEITGADTLAGTSGQSVILTGGTGGSGVGGRLRVNGSGDGSGGDVEFKAGDAGSGTDGWGGFVYFLPGLGDGAGSNGLVIMQGLPTADPVALGALWNDGGTLKVSAG